MKRSSSSNEGPPQRVVIERVAPEIDAGAFPAKATVGFPVDVEADIFVDGHDRLAAVMRWRKVGDGTWTELAMEELRESLSAARPLLEINTRVAADLVKRALTAALSLYGRSPGTDELLVALRDASPSLDTAAEIEGTLDTLEMLMAEQAG